MKCESTHHIDLHHRFNIVWGKASQPKIEVGNFKIRTNYFIIAQAKGKGSLKL